MSHPPTQYAPTEKRTTKFGRPIVRCPVCGREVPGTPAEPCAGRADAPVAAINLDCIHRLEKVATVPCGVCPQTNKQTFAGVYLCKAVAGGQACTLRPVGTGPEQRIHGAVPVVCSTCPIRKPPV